MAREARIEQAFRAHCENVLGVPTVKWGDGGWPDRIVLVPGGKPLFIEFKVPGAAPKPRQGFRKQCLEIWGYDVEVHDSTAEAVRSVAERLEATRLTAQTKPS